MVREGWRIGHTEMDLQAQVLVDGQPFTLTGRIDRIDRHDELGYRVFDYKTGDTGKAPEKTHRGKRDGKSCWVDLQLPLYRNLCEQLNLAGPIKLGYINLPKKQSETGPAIARWDDQELAEAFETRDGVIRALRGQVYWPPGDPARYPDGFERVCGRPDDAPPRADFSKRNRGPRDV